MKYFNKVCFHDRVVATKKADNNINLKCETNWLTNGDVIENVFKHWHCSDVLDFSGVPKNSNVALVDMP